MLGIGHRLDKNTKIKILAERAKQYNSKYDDMASRGIESDEIVKTLSQQQFNKRHQSAPIQEPYNISTQINGLGGPTNLGFVQSHKTMTATKTMYRPMQQKMQKTKQGILSRTGTGILRSPQQQKQFQKMKERIYKDHLQQDAEIDLGEKHASDYKLHYLDDRKMKQIRQTKDLQYHQRKNPLIWYAETYIKTKDSLRKF